MQSFPEERLFCHDKYQVPECRRFRDNQGRYNLDDVEMGDQAVQEIYGIEYPVINQRQSNDIYRSEQSGYQSLLRAASIEIIVEISIRRPATPLTEVMVETIWDDSLAQSVWYEDRPEVLVLRCHTPGQSAIGAEILDLMTE